MPDTKRVLIIKLSALGDVVQALPGAYALHCEGAKIDWVCGAAAVPILKCYSWINPIPIDENRLYVKGRINAALELLRLWRRIAGTPYELCATLHYDRRFRLLAAPIRARRKVMLQTQDREFALIPGRNYADEYARILLGRADSCTPASFTPVVPDRLPASPLPRTPGIRCIALVPGGARNLLRDNPLRRWPVEWYVALAGALLKRGCHVVLTGGPGDEWVAEAFAHLAVDNRIGQTQIPELIALYADCDAVVSHDTGPLHLAGLTGCLLIGLFGPTSPWMFLPRRAGALALWGGEGMACRPCYDGREYPPCASNKCMQSISPIRVLEALDRLLAEREGLAEPRAAVELIRPPQSAPVP